MLDHPAPSIIRGNQDQTLRDRCCGGLESCQILTCDAEVRDFYDRKPLEAKGVEGGTLTLRLFFVAFAIPEATVMKSFPTSLQDLRLHTVALRPTAKQNKSGGLHGPLEDQG